MPLHTAFMREVNEQIARDAQLPAPIMTEEAIGHLPEPVRRYLQNSGFVGQEIPFNGWTEYENSLIRVNEGDNFSPVQVKLFSTVPDPIRFGYLRSRMFGLFKMEVLGAYRNGQEELQIRLMNRIRLPFGKKGRLRNESSLAGLLADILFVPGYALQPYMKWTSIDERTARATLRHAGLEVSGIFRFDHAANLIQFDTEDRSYTLKDNSSVKVRSTVSYGDHQVIGGYRLPKSSRAFWHLATGDFEYFRADLAGIRYNLREPLTD